MGEAFFVEVLGPNGKPMLINLDLAGAIGQDEKGNAVIVTIAGAPIATAEPFKKLQSDFLGELKP